jgi:hypothetical protein
VGCGNRGHVHGGHEACCAGCRLSQGLAHARWVGLRSVVTLLGLKSVHVFLFLCLVCTTGKPRVELLRLLKCLLGWLEAMFMGVMKPAVEDAGSVKAWLMPGGCTQCWV